MERRMHASREGAKDTFILAMIVLAKSKASDAAVVKMMRDALSKYEEEMRCWNRMGS